MNQGGRSSLQQDFLRKWVMGLQAFTYFSNNQKHANVATNIFDRKKIIKLSADIAMASAKKPSTIWSRAVIMNASRDQGMMINKLLKRRRSGILKKKKKKKKKKMMKKKKKALEAKTMARRLVKKRTQVLKRLVPGGETMDGMLLIEETLDYIFSLQAQVDVMRFIAIASTTHPIPNQNN